MRIGAQPVLCLVVDRACSRTPLPQAVEAAAAAGVDWIQLRERGLEPLELIDFAEEVAEAARRGAGARRVELIVNRRIDVALALDANGVHLGFDALDPAAARGLLGGETLIGVSTHSKAEIAALAGGEADYVHLAPILQPLSKRSERPALGFDELAEATRHGIPVLAQGGVEAQHCAELIRLGAAGIAVTGAILMADDPATATRKLRRALDSART